MENNSSFANHVEQLILSEKLAQAGGLLLAFFKQYKDNTLPTKELQTLVVGNVNSLNNLNHRLSKNTIDAEEAALIEKNIWISFQQVNGQIRKLKDIEFSFADARNASRYVSTYENKPDTVQNAGWYPMVIAALVIAVAFSIGLYYNSGRIRERKTREQAAIDAKNGVVRSNAEGAILLKLAEEKTIKGAEDALTLTVKSVEGNESRLEMTLNIQNELTEKIKALNFVLIDSSKDGKETKAEENGANLGEIPATSTALNEKIIHFNYAVGDQRLFLLKGSFMTDGNLEKSIFVPIQLR